MGNNEIATDVCSGSTRLQFWSPNLLNGRVPVQFILVIILPPITSHSTQAQHRGAKGHQQGIREPHGSRGIAFCLLSKQDGSVRRTAMTAEMVAAPCGLM